MSELSQGAKKPLKKSPLGRGLGSLLGAGPDGAQAAQVTPETALKLPSQNLKPMQEGFIEEDQGARSEASKQATGAEIQSMPKAAVVPDHARVWEVDIAKIKGNPKQPRRSFAKEPLQELANSIREKGILQPIVARRLHDGDFEIIAGERRWRAAQLAGLHQVPVILRETKDQEALELALIENIQRQDLDPIEEAEAYSHLIRTYQLTQQQLADKIGKERVTIANTLRLLQLTPELRLWVREGRLSMGQAKVLLSLSDPNQQLQAARQALDNQLTVRALERLVAQMQAPSGQFGSKDSSAVSEEQGLSASLLKSLVDDLQRAVGTKVNLDYSKGKGKVSLHFYSDEELNRLVEKLKNF